MIQHSRVFPGALLADYLMIRIICPHKPACNALCHKVHQLFPRLVAPFDFLSSSKPCCQIMLGDALALHDGVETIEQERLKKRA